MITLIIAVIFPLSALSKTITFSMERSMPTGLDKLEITHASNQTTVSKNSNWFDKAADTRLGKFRPATPALLASILSELAEVETELVAADNRLKMMGKSFNSLNSSREPHSPYFRLNGFRVQTGSMVYPKLEKIAAKLHDLPLALQDGVELDQGRKHLVFFKNGKEVKREEFNAQFFCQSSSFPTRCLAREWGTLYLE